MIDATAFTAPIDLIKQAQQWQFHDRKMVVNEPTGNFFYDPWTVKEKYKGSVWDQLLSALPLNIGEARIIVLEPGETYMAHADIDDRWHLNIDGTQSYLIDLTDKKMFELTADGIWYAMDAGRLHVASNFGQVLRIQLVVRKLLMRCKLTNTIKVKIEPAYDQHDYRYTFDNIVSPWLNRLNKYGAMNNFKHQDLAVEFDIAESVLSMLDEISKENFKITYE
jgi:hypothetical protein